ncbi:MAG: protein-methionine-sulfoxide reductase catalytic subunit MsrP [Oligoflexus sp.]
MLIRVKDRRSIPSSAITDEQVFLNRRELLRSSLQAISFAPLAWSSFSHPAFAAKENAGEKLQAKANPQFQDPLLKSALTKFEDFSSYNNFFEFGTGKDDPKKHAHHLQTKPWTIKVSGHVEKAASYQLEDFLKPFELEDRIYRFRCVEAWSMVVPWIGFPLKRIIERVKPNSKARFVLFRSLHDPKQMPGQKRKTIDWPYQDALRLDEAMHDLTLLVVGAYGRFLPNQNGAPIRLIVPWKYGFKSIKSIVSMEFVSEQPKTSWEMMAPHEYPFYANVNPQADHPRWSQKTERVLGSGIFTKRQPTLAFNGYADQVEKMYRKFDPKKLY